MQEFIERVVSQLGTTETTARSATGGLLQMIQKQADPNDAKQLLNALPGASDLMDSAKGTAAGSSGGLLGGVMKQASSMMGGKLGDSLGVAQMLSSAGLGTSTLGPFVSMFLDFAKQKVGDDVVERTLGKLPELRQLVG